MSLRRNDVTRVFTRLDAVLQAGRSCAPTAMNRSSTSDLTKLLPGDIWLKIARVRIDEAKKVIEEANSMLKGQYFRDAPDHVKEMCRQLRILYELYIQRQLMGAESDAVKDTKSTVDALIETLRTMLNQVSVWEIDDKNDFDFKNAFRMCNEYAEKLKLHYATTPPQLSRQRAFSRDGMTPRRI